MPSRGRGTNRSTDPGRIGARLRRRSRPGSDSTMRCFAPRAPGYVFWYGLRCRSLASGLAKIAVWDAGFDVVFAQGSNELHPALSGSQTPIHALPAHRSYRPCSSGACRVRRGESPRARSAASSEDGDEVELLDQCHAREPVKEPGPGRARFGSGRRIWRSDPAQRVAGAPISGFRVLLLAEAVA